MNDRILIIDIGIMNSEEKNFGLFSSVLNVNTLNGKIIIIVLLLLIFHLKDLQQLKGQHPVSWWTFDEINNNQFTDEISKVKDTLLGYRQLAKGVSGSSLKLDGYTTRVVRRSTEVPEFADGFAIESWIALQALPWNWSAIVSQGGHVIQQEHGMPADVNLNNLSMGLTGAQFGNADLTNPLGKQELLSTDNDWTGSMNDWSNRWRGYIEAPYTGEVHFKTEADNGLQLTIDNNIIIEGWEVDGPRTGSLAMIKGDKYPVILTYENDRGKAILRLFWSWQTQKEILIPIEAFGYSEKDDRLATEDVVPPKSPDPEYEHKIFFGVGAHGHLGFKLNINGRLYECVSEEKLPLLKWSHVAATFDSSEGMKVFINGDLAAELEVQGTITPEEGSDLLLGMNIQKLSPVGSERQASANIKSKMVLYGLLDEIKIYNQPLTGNYIKESYKADKPNELQALTWNKMPSGPEVLPPRFDGFYTKLMYTDEWEAPRRESDHPDILIHFDKLPIRFIFWRGTNYGGAWVTENGLWMGDQSVERAGRGKSPLGCSEHMSDKQSRYGNVRIIEKNDARIVVQWRYAIADIIYDIFGTNIGTVNDTGDGWGEWAEEFYYIYPDGVSTRLQTLWTEHLSHEFQETIVLNHPGTYPDDNLEINALTLANMDGEYRTFSWKNDIELFREARLKGEFTEPEKPNIQVVNLKSQYKPFIIFEPNPKIAPFNPNTIRPEYSHFPWWNHWPVGQLPNDGRRALGPDRASHSSLSQSVEESEVIHNMGDGSYEVVTLVGMTDKPAASLAMLARSWNNAPGLSVQSKDFNASGYSKKERAFIISNNNEAPASELKFTLFATENSPVVNPSFVIKNWGDADVVLTVNGKKLPRGDSFRYGFRKTLQGTDLVLWIELRYDAKVSFALNSLRNRNLE